eukprot:7402334-Pyramimonas_sp.AAC.1
MRAARGPLGVSPPSSPPGLVLLLLLFVDTPMAPAGLPPRFLPRISLAVSGGKACLNIRLPFQN